MGDDEEGEDGDDAAEGDGEVSREMGEEEAVSGSTPLLFYGVEGRDMSDDDSPSFFNPIEALQVCAPPPALPAMYLRGGSAAFGGFGRVIR